MISTIVGLITIILNDDCFLCTFDWKSLSLIMNLNELLLRNNSNLLWILLMIDDHGCGLGLSDLELLWSLRKVSHEMLL
jgi:hypothetical protein